jgi:hypothetical protein
LQPRNPSPPVMRIILAPEKVLSAISRERDRVSES